MIPDAAINSVRKNTVALKGMLTQSRPGNSMCLTGMYRTAGYAEYVSVTGSQVRR